MVFTDIREVWNTNREILTFAELDRVGAAQFQWSTMKRREPLTSWLWCHIKDGHLQAIGWARVIKQLYINNEQDYEIHRIVYIVINVLIKKYT